MMPLYDASRIPGEILARCEAYEAVDPAVWIHRLTPKELSSWLGRIPSEGPLRGLTFAIKDNIDLEGIPTTAACPGFARTPTTSAEVVRRLVAAGALPIGKTNLDQFATGLVGTRSPHGAPRCVSNPAYISGGSSSGSAVAVAAGLADFALGTDTAGSGRVPAGINHLIGLKPTRGRLSTRGVLPACRSLDCVSIFAKTIHLASEVLAAAEGFDRLDPFSRRIPLQPATVPANPTLGIPRDDQLDWFGNPESAELFRHAVVRMRDAGVRVEPVDFGPFLEAARLLYEGPWTSERTAAVGDFIQSALDQGMPGIDPTVAEIILSGRKHSAVDTFRAYEKLAALKRAADEVLDSINLLAAPTVGTVYRIDEISADPVRLNSNLGRLNNFMNLLDLCGLTIPLGRYSSGVGFGITLIGPAWHDLNLLELGSRVLGEPSPRRSQADAQVVLAVCGAHLKGQPLHGQLRALNATFLRETRTAPRYRLYSLPSSVPPKPGLVRARLGEASGAIDVELYSFDASSFGHFVAKVPPPLSIGSAELEDGSWVKSFLCEPHALADAQEITEYGGWRSWLDAGSTQ